MSHKSNYCFTKDKILGENAELFVLDLIKKFYPTAYKVVGKNIFYDIIVPSDKDPNIPALSFEVKNDLRAESTGNIAIEFGKKDGTPTGIIASKADYYIIVAAGNLYLSDRKELLAYCQNSNHRVTNGGDNWKTQMWLVKLSEIEKEPFFIKLNMEDESENSNN